MKTLASFIVIVLLGTTSLVKWFEAPRNQFVGEPVTVISIEPPNEQNATVVKTAAFPAVSFGSYGSYAVSRKKPDPEPSNAPESQDPTGSIVDTSTPENATVTVNTLSASVNVTTASTTADTTPQRVRLSKRSIPPSQIDAGSASPVMPRDTHSTSPFSPDTSVAAIANDTVALPETENVPRKPYDEQQAPENNLVEITPPPMQAPIIDVALPVRAPKRPATAPEDAPVEYISISTQPEFPGPPSVSANEIRKRKAAAERQARLRAQAKLRAVERARKLKAQKAKKKSSSKWQSAILGAD